MLEERRLNGSSPGARRHESHRDLAVDVVAHAERTRVGDVGMLEQAVRDLERGDVDPALDDDVLLAAGDVDVAFLVAPREIAVAEPILRNRHELVRALPVRRGELPSADDHLALLAGRELASGVVQNAHAHVQGRPPDGAELAMPGMVATHEAGLGAAGELHDRDAVGLLELHVLVDGERRGRRGHEAKRRQIRVRHGHRPGEEHVDHGRDADADRDPILAQPVEEARLRELAREHERGPGQHRRPDREDLGRGPAEVTVVEDRVGLADLEPVDRGLAHGVVRLVGPDRTLRRIGRARGVVDQGPVRPRRACDDGRVGLRGEPREEIVGGLE